MHFIHSNSCIFKGHPDSIRALYGLSDTRNACHGSDSVDSASKEIRIFFPTFNYEEELMKATNEPKKL